MALVNCKECGGQVSTKAAVCPKCGAKAPKRTSPFTWVLLIFVVAGVYNFYLNLSPKSTSSTSDSSSSKESSSRKPFQAIEDVWQTVSSKDEMSGERSSYAISPRVESKSPMSFPYHGTQAWLGIGCDKNNEWAYIGFTKEPNLTDAKHEAGYKIINTRFKWDERLEVLSFTQKWGSKSIQFYDQDSAISSAASAETAVLELDWHGQKPVHFEFSLKGSSSAILKIRSECSRY